MKTKTGWAVGYKVGDRNVVGIYQTKKAAKMVATKINRASFPPDIPAIVWEVV